MGAADLGAADLGAADLGAADFGAADFGDVDFFDADFTADFTGVDFVCDEFAGTDLASPDLADLVGFVKPLLGAFPAVAECAPGLAAVFFALGGLFLAMAPFGFFGPAAGGGDLDPGVVAAGAVAAEPAEAALPDCRRDGGRGLVMTSLWIGVWRARGGGWRCVGFAGMTEGEGRGWRCFEVAGMTEGEELPGNVFSGGDGCCGSEGGKVETATQSRLGTLLLYCSQSARPKPDLDPLTTVHAWNLCSLCELSSLSALSQHSNTVSDDASCAQTCAEILLRPPPIGRQHEHIATTPRIFRKPYIQIRLLLIQYCRYIHILLLQLE